jgi:hypothetical protein
MLLFDTLEPEEQLFLTWALRTAPPPNIVSLDRFQGSANIDGKNIIT